jgi:ketosteroid isomerase-like protein
MRPRKRSRGTFPDTLADPQMSANLELIKSMMPAEIDLVDVVNSDNPAAMFGAVAGRVSQDVEVMFAPPPTGGPGLEFHGLDGLVEGWRDWLSPWDSYRITAEEFIDAGENVVLHAHVAARTERHGVDVEHSPSSVWTVKDGVIVAVHFFLDRDDALAFAGVA